MAEYDDKFSKNDLYLIEENLRRGNDDFLELFVGDKEFVVPYSCTIGSNTDKQSVLRFENQLFDFEDKERGKYNSNRKRVKTVEYEGREFVVPFGYEGKINPEEIAKNAIKKASVKYNMIINAHRELKEAGIDVGEIQFYDSSAEKYTKLLKENNRAVLLSENTPEMVQVLNFLENVGDKTKVYGGEIKRIGKEALRKSGEYIEEYGKRGINIVCENVKDGSQKLKRNLKKKIAEIEFDASKRYIPKGYKVAMLAGLLAVGGIGVVKNVNFSDGQHKEQRVQKKKKRNDGTYMTYSGKILQDKHGNLARMNELREELTILMTAVEGFSNESFTDGKGISTAGIGNTVLYDEKGNETRVSPNTVLSNQEVIVQKFRYNDENMMPILATVDRPCSDEELLVTFGAGFCWGPTGLSKSQYFKSLKEGASVEELTRKLTGFRMPSGLVKREYLLACVLNKKWSVDDLKDMPVYHIRDKGYLHCAVYTLDFDDICKCKTDAKGNYIYDKYKNKMPKPDEDGYCSLYLDRADEILDRLCNDRQKYGKSKTVDELLPDDVKEYLRSDFALSDLQERYSYGGEQSRDIKFGDALAMVDNYRSK
ncbi:MAG: hypothetical protein IJZ30_05605 [Alphaproteobacteria bacterium]|nr:hypothetical protein [Alphaproteobacteria bacterium]